MAITVILENDRFAFFFEITGKLRISQLPGVSSTLENQGHGSRLTLHGRF
jgi:hypothetical protein